MADRWAGRTVLITGGAGGMGRAFARLFIESGAAVVLSDIDEPSIGAAVAALAQSASGSVEGVRCDVTEPTDCRRTIERVIEKTGRLDLLINAAGVWTEGPTEATRDDDWDRVIDVNLKGTFLMCRHALPHLERSQGSIVNISSDAGLIATSGVAVYSASKAGVNMLTKAMALEFAERGVRVNAVCPTDVDTPMIEYQATTFGKGDPAGYKRALLARYPQRSRARFVRPEEVAALVFFLSSPEAEPITGACLSIDFGTTAGLL
jgi:NAD(P)-dependent dehydrogenase (short-subunit alcohol dehydrogenase family)